MDGISRDTEASGGFADVSRGFDVNGEVWDENKLEAWRTNPQALIAGAIMPYRQARPEIRSALIAYMKELH
jgi:cytochrome c